MRMISRFPKFPKFLVGAALLVAGLCSSAAAQSVWDNRNPITQTNNLNGLTWTGSQFVGVGTLGTVVTSANGITWTVQNSGNTASTLYGVASNGATQLVAVGAAGLILTSSNSGVSWTQATSPTNNALFGVTWSGSRYVAVGVSGTVVTSTDGTNWSIVGASLTTQGLNSVTYSSTSSKYVAVGNSSAVLVSSDGLNWSVATSGATLYSVVWTGNEFIGVGASGLIRASSDGATWTSRTTANTTTLLATAFGPRLVAMGSSGSIQQSADAASWSVATSGTTQSLNAVAWSSTLSKFVAVGGSGTVLTSTDGLTWTQTSSIISGLNAMTSRIATDTLLVVVGDAGTIMTSTNGVTWTKRTSNTTSNLYAVAWSGTVFAATGAASALVTSSDGLTWTSQTGLATLISGGTMWGIAGNNATLVAVGQDGSAAGTIAVSSNSGGSWASPTNINAPGVLYSVTNNAGTFVAVGNPDPNGSTGSNIRSATTPTTTWSIRGIGLTQNRLNSIAYSGSQYVAVGQGGTVVTSSNVTTWALQSSGFTTDLKGVTANANNMVAVGNGGKVYSSPTGVTWTAQTSGTTSNLFTARWDGRLYAAAGAGGRILTSSPAALPSVPTPGTPAASAIDVPVNPILSWASVSGATTYGLQVSLNSGFTTTVLDTVSASTNYTAGPLTPGTQYFWRLRSNGTAGSSAWSTGSSFTVIGSGTSAPNPTSPANAAVNVALSATLTWDAYTSGALSATSYRVQMSKDSLFSTFIVNDSVTGTSRLLGSLDTLTKYFWRVNARLSTGVTAWSTLRRFTTTPAAPSAPALVTPVDNANSISLTTASLNWSPASGASSYRVQFSTSSTFATVIKDTVVTGTTTLAVPGLAANTVYYWHVNAQNPAGSSVYSATRTFTTAVPLSAPTLNLPANNATAVTVFTDVSWNALSGAVTYQLQLATDTGFTAIVVNDSTLTGTTRNVGQLSNLTVYYWRVRAKNPAGNSAYSTRRTFTSASLPTTVPAAPVLVAPAAFATTVSAASAVFTWKTAATASLYRLEISTDPAFSPANAVVVKDSTLTDTTKTVTTLSGGVDYYWRVSAKNNVGYGSASEIRAFTTVATIPAVPVLLTPAQFDVGVSVSPTLTWNLVSGATKYIVQVSTTTTFSGTALILNDTVTTGSRTIGPLGNNTDYYWQVRALNTAGASAFSSPRRFTTGVAPVPGVPTLVFPAQFATSVAVPVSLKWNKVSGATRYLVLVSTAPFSTGAPIVVQDSSATDTTLTVSTLAGSTDYYWKVSARNSAGAGEFSGISRFSSATTAIMMNRLSLGRRSAIDAGSLRFALPAKERVVIRLFSTQGRKLAADFDETLEAGYHAVPLPAELNGTFYLIEFQSASFRQILKIHP
jgi:photosystem II stability/assembly factor-like uncharacterized protein